MKTTRRMIISAMIMVLLTSLFCVPASASSASSDFAVENGILTKYNGTGGSVVIPDNLGIITIGASAFGSCTALTSVIIPDGVTSISDHVFDGCINLKSVSLPNSVTFVNAWAFAGADNITSPIYINNGSILCYVPRSVSDFTIPETVTTINGNAFGGNNNLKAVKIPDSVTTIDGYAFWYCMNLRTIIIPSSVISVGDKAFGGTSIQSPILINNSTVLCYVPSSFTSYSIPDTVTQICGGAFYNCKNLNNVTIPSSVIYIGPEAFSGTIIDHPILINNSTVLCYVPASYSSYTIPKTVTEINGGAFEGCGALTNIVIPEGITYIGAWAFIGCGGISTISIPRSVSKIDANAFWYCQNLTSIVIPETVSELGDNLFTGSDKVTIFGIPNSKAQVYANKYNIPFKSTVETAAATAANVTVNGSVVKFEAYTINGNNYFKLRDLAKTLDGSAKQFDVGWDGAMNAISLTSGKPYSPVGGELISSGISNNTSAYISTAAVYLDGKLITLTAYKINGYNYFKLRDFASALDFGVIWDGTKNTIGIDTSTGYAA